MKKEYAEEVAAKIIEQLEQGTAPWQKPWKPGELSLPYNGATGKEYRGMNSMWLAMQGHSDPRWMTYNQAADAGAQVRKGSKGTKIIYWKFREDQKAVDAAGNPILDEEGKQKTISVELERPRAFHAVVFNAEQIDGLPALKPKVRGSEPERHARAEAILANSGAKIQHVEGDRAFYRPSTDSITLPERHQFTSPDNYYATALHELGHWTGHPSRLDRDLAHPFGSAGYAREELRAEIASLMLGERMDIGHDPGQHAAYVGSWIKVLKEDPKEIFRAASDAEKITSFVMAFEQEKQQEQQQESAIAHALNQDIGLVLQSGEYNFEHFRSFEGESLDEALRAKGLGTIGSITGTEPTRFYEIAQDRLASIFGANPKIDDLNASLELKGLSGAFAEMAQDIAKAIDKSPAIDLPPSDPQQLRNEANRGELLALQRQAGATLEVLPSDMELGEKFKALLEQASTRSDSVGDAAKSALEYFSAAYDRETPNWQLVGYDVRTGTGTAGPGNGTPPIVEGFMLRALSGGGREALTELVEAEAKKERPHVLHATPEKTMTGRTYLAVPYSEKDEAKKVAAAAGFKLGWDKEAKAWYAPEGADLKAVERWSADKPNVITQPPARSVEEQFSEALKNAGLILPGAPVMDGKIHRVPVEGDKGNQASGAYAGHLEGRMPGGFIQNYKTGEQINWKAEGKIEQLSAEEKAQLAAEAAQRQQRRDQETQTKHEATAAAAAVMWREAPAAGPDNEYCKAKGIDNPAALGLRTVPESASPDADKLGIKIAKTAQEAKALRDADPNARVFKAGDLLIPGYDKEGKLWTLQTVNPAFKSFMKGGRKAGLFTVAGANPEGKLIAELLADKTKPILVAEGYATADTVAKLAGQPVISAFDSGNLDAVATALIEKLPGRIMVIAADNDHNAPKEIGPDGLPRKNVGLEKANEASKKFGAGVAAPQFKDGEKGSDWNDVRAANGDEEARKQFAEQMAVAKRDAAIISERITTLARTRDMEARNDPTTSLDDAAIAAERGKAASMIVAASEQNSQVRSASADGMLGSKATRPAASATASIEKKTETLRDTAKKERQEVSNPAQGTDAQNKPQATKQPTQRRTRGIDAGM